MIVNKEIDKTDIYDIASEVFAQYQADIVNIKAEQITQNNDILQNTNDIISINNTLSTINNEQITQNNNITTNSNNIITINNTISNIQLEQITQNNNITTNSNNIMTINNTITDIQNDIIDINTEQSTQNTWLTTLESQTYPEALWTLSDVQITLSPTEDNKIIYYDSTSDKFKLKTDQGGIPDAPADSAEYIWIDNTWQLLATSTPITGLSTDISTINGTLSSHTTQINNIQLEQTTQNNNITTLQNEQITQNNNITTNTNDIITINNTLSNINLDYLQDVDLTIPPTTNQILKYNGTQWTAAADSGGISALS